jgi:hypothetical protein
VFSHYATWEEALRAAGCTIPAQNVRLEPDHLLEDWGKVAAKLRRVPTIRDYLVHGSHRDTTLTDRFGSWKAISGAFRAFAGTKPRWKRVLKYLEGSRWRTDSQCAERAAATQVREVRSRRRAPRLPHRPVCGFPLERGALRYAPTNEQGVVLLFGKMAEQLGFFVVGLQSAFPDCLAMREITPGNWQPVTIEFEFLSRSFQIHRHKTDGCDIIVCWEHNWKECPKNLEVIALRDEIGGMEAG